jgi:hypothetical protein
MLQPPWLSAHFVARPIFVSPSLPLKPARSARPFGPVQPARVSSPTSGSDRHCRPSGYAAVPCATVCRSSPRVSSQTEPALPPSSFPHQDDADPSPLPPLTPLKLTRSKTPPSPAASPPPHRLLGPIKCTLASASASPHRTRCSPPSLFFASPVTRHQAPLPPSPPLHHRPQPAIAPVTKARGEEWQDPLYLFLQLR